MRICFDFLYKAAYIPSSSLLVWLAYDVTNSLQMAASSEKGKACKTIDGLVRTGRIISLAEHVKVIKICIAMFYDMLSAMK